MSNMSYCRFQITRMDLQDCLDTLEEMVEGEEKFEDLSTEEKRAMKNMLEICIQFIEYTEDIENA